MDHFKISTSRDFRINANSLQQALESRGHEGSDDDDDDSKQGDNDKVRSYNTYMRQDAN